MTSDTRTPQTVTDLIVVDRAPDSASLGLLPSWPDDVDTTIPVGITSREECAVLEERWVAIKRRMTEIRAFFEPRKAGAREVWQQWVDDEKTSLKPYVATEAAIKRLLTVYVATCEKAAREETLRLEAQASEEAHRSQIAAAIQAVSDGAMDAAVEILSLEPVTMPVIVIAERTTLPLVSQWTAKVHDLNILILRAAEEIQRRAKVRLAVSMLQVNQPMVNKHASALKERLATIAESFGLTVTETKTPRMRG